MIDDSPYSPDDLALAETLVGEGMSFDAVYQRLLDRGTPPDAALALRNDLYQRTVSGHTSEGRPFLSAREYDAWEERQAVATPDQAADNRTQHAIGLLAIGGVIATGYLAGMPVPGIVASVLILALLLAKRQGSWPFSCTFPRPTWAFPGGVRWFSFRRPGGLPFPLGIVSHTRPPSHLLSADRLAAD